MDKKLFRISVLLLLFFCVKLTAQNTVNKWWIVQDLPDKIVYLDTSSVKSNNNTISVWSLVIYRSPIKLNAFKEEISRIKSQYLFNNINQKYSVIGTLYYNSRSRIVGESVSPAITGSGDRFTLAIQPGSPVDRVYQKARDFLELGRVTSDPSQYLGAVTRQPEEDIIDTSDVPEETIFVKDEEPEVKTEDQLPDDPLLLGTFESAIPKEEPKIDSSLIVDETEDTKDDQTNINPTIIPGPTAKDILGNPDLNNDDTTRDNSSEASNNESSLGQRRVYDPITGKYVAISGNGKLPTPVNESTDEKPKVVKDDPPKVTTVSNSGYNDSSDRNVKGNIWSDGNLFCIQVSSWRTKSVAQNEVNKLKANGHNAYIMEKYISSKKGTYNRVRVGYFNSLQEAEDYRRTLK